MLKCFLIVPIVLMFAAQCLYALPATPILVTFQPCPGGSARPYSWLLYEDKDGDGLYDFVTAGGCDGSTMGRPLGSANADPFAPSPYDTYYGQLMANAGIDSVGLHGVHTQSGSSLYAWTVTEYHQGTPVCSYSRTDSGVLESTCPPSDLH